MVIVVEMVVCPLGRLVEEERERSVLMDKEVELLVQVVRDCLRGLRGVLLQG
jgi:hypothetical protein